MVINIPKKFMTHYLFILDPDLLEIVFAAKMLNVKGISIEDERNTKSSKPSFATRLWQPCDFQENTRNEYSHKMRSWDMVVTEERSFI